MANQFVPTSVLANATNVPGEILITGSVDGEARNVTINDQVELKQQLLSTPQFIENPAFTPLKNEAFELAIAKYTEQTTVPAPAGD